ncbi:MAG TPA: 2-amino-4-hydroxy-6-hydroxymethyldihydropteridine diphosphokinase [Sphingobacteriaceae bacterium]
MQDVYLMLGSNLGDRKAFLLEACKQIAERIGMIVSSSSLYETASWGRSDQPDYINQAVHLRTSLTALEVLNRALAIEAGLGRERLEKWDARVIDIDVLFYGTSIIEQPGLIIPHPHLHKRAFVLFPLREIAPSLIHPVLKTTITELCNNLADNSSVRPI